jgi:hypothetical protein
MKNSIVFIVITLLFSSCIDEVNMKVESFEPMIVLDGEINDHGEKQILRLSFSQPYFQEGTKLYLDNAQVTLFEDEVAVGTYESKGSGIYELLMKGQVGKEYSIAVLLPEIPEHPGFSGKKIVSEPELLAPISEITDIRMDFRPESLIYSEGYYLLINTSDPVGKGNFYRWKMKVNGEFTKSSKEIFILDDEMVDGNDFIDLDLTFDPFKVGDSVVVRQQSITKHFYQFLLDVYMQALTQESFFDSPAYNPHSNLKSDIPVVGYFNASAYTEASITVEEK